MGDLERPEPGEITSLGLILEQHYEDLEADLAFRGIDLADLWRGRLSWRKLWLLVERLPIESLTHTALRDSLTDEQRASAAQRVAKHGPWSKQDYLLAAAVDAIRETTWVLARVNGSTVDPPKPIDRPGLPTKPSRGTPEGIALMQEIVANGGGIPERFARKPEPAELEEGEGEWLDGS